MPSTTRIKVRGRVRESPWGSTLGLAIAVLKMTGSLSRVSSNRCHLNKRAKIAMHPRRLSISHLSEIERAYCESECPVEHHPDE